MKVTTAFFILFVGALAYSAEHSAHHGLDEHQKKTILFQTINVGLLFFGLFYFLTKPIKAHFAEKKRQHEAAADRAEQFKKSAEQEKLQIQVKLTKLESTADESRARAQVEAADLKRQLVEEAKNISKRIKEEAHEAAKNEIVKAKIKLREQMVGQAASLAETSVETKLKSEEQRRLQEDFIDAIGLAKR